jgi:maleylpyruvate isomerase
MVVLGACAPSARYGVLRVYREARVTGPRAEILAWWREGEQTLRGAVDALPDADLAGPSLLPGWTRHILVAHVAGNADAMINLVTWARTGVETPMYASAGARDEGIEQAAALSPAELRAEFAASQDRLATAIGQLPETAWDAEVRTPEGRPVPVSDVPWMRARETWVHGVDLAGRVTFADVPADLASALITNIVRGWQDRDEVSGVAFAATDTGQRWAHGARDISATQADLLAWMTGRGSADAIQFNGPPWAPPPWL